MGMNLKIFLCQDLPCCKITLKSGGAMLASIILPGCLWLKPRQEMELFLPSYSQKCDGFHRLHFSGFKAFCGKRKNQVNSCSSFPPESSPNSFTYTRINVPGNWIYISTFLPNPKVAYHLNWYFQKILIETHFHINSPNHTLTLLELQCILSYSI